MTRDVAEGLAFALLLALAAGFLLGALVADSGALRSWP
jgi:hypothetical protein